jgi:hypothetical protein
MRAVAFMVVGVIVALAPVARAEDSFATPDPPATARSAPTEPAWRSQPKTGEVEYDDYRLSLVAVDASAVTLIVSGAILGVPPTVSTVFFFGGVGTYALGGPIVHLVHEQNGRALGSFALRVGLPAVGIGAFAGLGVSCGEGGELGACLGAVLLGGVLTVGGVLAAMIVDDAVLGKAPKARKAPSARTFSTGVAPLFDPKEKRVGLSLVGAF